MAGLALPRLDRSVERYRPGPPSSLPVRAAPCRCRTVFAAAHVVADPLAPVGDGAGTGIDWEATIAYRRHLWGLGFKVAEAMDTAQRGAGLDWPAARELIQRSIEAARDIEGADLASGAGTDQLAPADGVTLDQVRRAYEEQIEAIEAGGGKVILMASRALARAARSPDDYLRIYHRLIDQCQDKVILHWLGTMFDPALHGYWGSEDLDLATDVFLRLVETDRQKIDGVKISLLDAEREIDLRRRLPASVKLFTGDDFHYPELIRGDGDRHSDALLGIFDAIAPAAAAALQRLDRGDGPGYQTILEPTVTLARTIFAAPTRHYKTGITLLAWLNGHQGHFVMLGGLQAARSTLHLADVFRCADRAGLLVDPELAARRMAGLMALAGIEQP